MTLEHLKRDIEYSILLWNMYINQWKNDKNAQKETPHFLLKAEAIVNTNKSILAKILLYENTQKLNT